MKRLKLQTGSNIVEFALILPLLLVLVFGIIDFGLALFDKAVLTNASREGARAGMVFKVPRLTDAEIEAVVQTYAGNHLITFGTPNLQTTITRFDVDGLGRKRQQRGYADCHGRLSLQLPRDEQTDPCAGKPEPQLDQRDAIRIATRLGCPSALRLP